MIRKLRSRSRRLHRLLVPIAAAPLAVTALSGAVYGTLLAENIDAPWLIRLHTGHFGLLNLQPVYAPLIGGLTLILIFSGIMLLLSPGRDRNDDIKNRGSPKE